MPRLTAELRPALPRAPSQIERREKAKADARLEAERAQLLKMAGSKCVPRGRGWVGTAGSGGTADACLEPAAMCQLCTPSRARSQ